ncbi:MAG: outer membrane lipoprotein-sorting protein [Burkholderiales bacterium]|nr:outer membrane lipoprotein-sorting protein [Burkholderiales bacterium]
MSEFLPLVLLFCCAVAIASPDPRELLARSDHARGGGLPGIEWEIRLSSWNGNRQEEPQRLVVKAIDDASVAETLEPSRFRGSRLLQVGRNMWLYRPGLSKPIPISPRLRMSGEAANGDIAATDYAKEYDASFGGEEKVDGEPCFRLDLAAKKSSATYDRIRYWVSEARTVAVRAEYYSVSGKLLKSAQFEYANEIDYRGRRIPFVSRMTIRDALTPAETVMEFSSVRVVRVAPAEFDLGQIE